MKHEIDKSAIVDNLKQMINLLEYDSQRSPGKAKMNSQHLHSMHWLLENVYKEKTVAKPTPKKEG